jgi:hypothetical protein
MEFKVPILEDISWMPSTTSVAMAAQAEAAATAPTSSYGPIRTEKQKKPRGEFDNSFLRKLRNALADPDSGITWYLPTVNDARNNIIELTDENKAVKAMCKAKVSASSSLTRSLHLNGFKRPKFMITNQKGKTKDFYRSRQLYVNPQFSKFFSLHHSVLKYTLCRQTGQSIVRKYRETTHKAGSGSKTYTRCSNFCIWRR